MNNPTIKPGETKFQPNPLRLPYIGAVNPPNEQAQKYLDECRRVKYAMGANFHEETRRLLHQRGRALFRAKTLVYEIEDMEHQREIVAEYWYEAIRLDEELIHHLAQLPGYTPDRVRDEFSIMYAATEPPDDEDMS